MTLELIASTFRLSTPLMLAAMGGVLCERAGVVNIALEGLMLSGAWAAAVGSLAFHSAWLGAGCGALAALAMGALYGLCVLPLRGNQIVAGMGMNMLAFGLTPFLCKIFYDVTGSTPMLPLNLRFESAPVFLAVAAVIATEALLRYSRFGLRVSFAGENPHALEAAGVSVARIRWLAVLLGSAIAGLGGASLSLYLSSSFSRNMSAGRGFMALAALIFGKWRPLPAAGACLLFGFAEAAQIRIERAAIAGSSVPLQLVQILPYVATIIVLAGFVGRARAPRALGIPFERE